MQSNYEEYKYVIKSILTDDNIIKILKDQFSLKFAPEVCQEIVKSSDKVSKFLTEFDKIDYPEKYEDFITATNEISDWIGLFLKDQKEAKNAIEKFRLIFRIFRIQNDDFVNSLMLNEDTLIRCFKEGMINDQLYYELKASLPNKGEINTKLKFFWNINLKGPDCLWKLLWIYYQTNTNFISEYLPDLNNEINLMNSDEEKKKRIQDYSNKILSEKSQIFKQNAAANNQDDDDDDDNEESDETCSDLDHLANLYETAYSTESDGDDGEFQLRKYQKELIECGIKEGNTIICAPTGSGKTIVAIKIIEEHLKNNLNGKVVFLVHRVALADQQANALKKCLKRDVNCISGGSKTNTPLTWNLESDNIFVLTADILLNNLELQTEYKLKSITSFTLVIFDECHNVNKKHPYNQIMAHYFADKKKGLHVPKIIGLTASTGTNKAKSMEEGLAHIINLCGNLDAYKVSTVKNYKDELKSVQSNPDDKILKPDQRSSDQFEKDLQITMGLCERILKDMGTGCFRCIPDIQAITKFPEDRFAPKYLNILGKLDTDIYTITKGKTNQISVNLISRYLKVCCNALKVNHLFRKVDAIKLINDELGSSIENSELFVKENLIKDKLRELIKNPEKCDQSSNPSLEMLKTEINNQLLTHDSRIIVFVRDRKHTLILKDIFSLELPEINCEVAMGNEGLTRNEMQETLKRFTDGDVKVLFATTVIEEGHDIPKCNMVIRYGHVTNETSMIQSKGRARAPNSKYRVIVPFKMRWQIQKEMANKTRAEIMYNAINEFQKLDEDVKITRITSCQSERNSIPDLEKGVSKLSISSQSDDSIWEFHCKCDKLICSSKDIRLAESNLYIVMNQECFSSMKLPETRSKNECQILCASCYNQIGNRRIYKKLSVPNLNIKFFYLKQVGNDDVKLIKKWSNIPFNIIKFSSDDLKNFNNNHSLSD